MAKGYNHETVKALETHPKAVAWTIEFETLWSQPSGVVLRHMGPGSQPNAI